MLRVLMAFFTTLIVEWVCYAYIRIKYRNRTAEERKEIRQQKAMQIGIVSGLSGATVFLVSMYLPF